MNAVANNWHLLALGRRILSEANDLKRTREALAAEIDMDQDTVRAVIEGRADLETAHAVIHAMTKVYPISVSDLWIEPDDTDAGVRIMRGADSAATSRVIERKDGNGRLSPYYEYRDTAMSRTTPFKPEWIQPLRVVGDSDPDHPDVAYNNGHLLHQCTFFIGAVNFYWRIGGRSYSAEMNTGDSNYIAPFVPHSFASRDPDRLGLILAVTYAGQVRHAIDDFARVGAEAADTMAGDTSDANGAFQACMVRHLAAESLDRSGLVERLESSGVERARAQRLANGGDSPTDMETAVLAEVLHVSAKDLTVTPIRESDAVSVRFARNVPSRPYPNGNTPVCRIGELARNRHQPGLKGFDITVLDGASGDYGDFRHGLHQYIYNYGDVPVTLRWDDGGDTRTDVLEPDDSAVVRAMVNHGFAVDSGKGEGRLAVIRVPGGLNDRVIEEFAAFSPEGRNRVAGETKQWF